MNKTRFLKKNNYFRPALYIKLIVDNVKYRGIQCDFGRLTKLFFVTPDSLLFAVQRDTDFFQCTYYVPVFNPVQNGGLNKAGFVLQKCNMPPAERKWHEEKHSCTEQSLRICMPETGSQHPDATVSETRVSCLSGRQTWFPNRDYSTANKNSQYPVKENSTVFQLIKPSAEKITLIAEGRISESRAKRACLTIRLFNN
jgi:hypothetical protein